jgi:DNA adenine methylase
MRPVAVPQAFPYQGSKRALAGHILSLFPDGGVPRLIEPFAGSAAISLAARHHAVAETVHLADVNAPLIALWNLIIHDPSTLLTAYARMWHEQQPDPRAYYLRVREEFNATHRPELLLHLLCRCVKAAVRYSRTGDFNQAPDHRRLGARPPHLAARITAASRLLRGATTTATESYADPLVNAAPEDLVYLDPPYQGTSDVPDPRYLTGLRREAFADTLQAAVDNKVSFIVSYDAVREDNKYGLALPPELGLTHRHVVAGVSTQATLQGRRRLTVESLYLSPALLQRLGGKPEIDRRLSLPPREPQNDTISR